MNTQIGPLRGVSNFLVIMFNKVPIEAEVDARSYVILENYHCFYKLFQFILA